MRTLLYSLAVVVVAVLNGVLHLKTPGDWWFEDDPMIYGVVQSVPNPLSFFFDPAAGTGAVGPNEMAPVLLGSLAADNALAPRSPALAYSHSILVYALSAAAFFLVVRRLLRRDLPAFLLSVTWALLPSTLVVVEFLSARHYMYGMLFGLLSIELAERSIAAAAKSSRGRLLTAFAVCAWVSLISKEMFPPALLTLAFLRFAQRRLWAGAGICVGLALGYAGYRFWMTNPGLVYRDLPLAGPADFLVFLGRLPYIFFGGSAGYVALAGAVLVLIRRLAKDRALLIPAAIFLTVLLVALATVYPVAMPVSAAWRSLGTWYRTPFVINTLALVLIGMAWSLLESRRVGLVLYLGTFAAVANGAHLTSRRWDRMKEAQRLEAEFFMQSPGELLFSWTEAYWFLPGIKMLYPEIHTARFVSRWPGVSAADRAMLLTLDRVWTRKDGRIESIDRQEMRKILDTIP